MSRKVAATACALAGACAAPSTWPAERAVPSMDGTLLQMFLGLAAILALVLGIAWLARRFTPYKGAQGSVRVLGGTALGARERLLLVEAEGVRMLIGVAPGRVQAVHVFAPGRGGAPAAERAAPREAVPS